MDAGIFRHIVASAHQFKDEVVFRFEKERMILHTVDEGHVCMMHLEMPRELFKVYEPENEPIKVSVADLRNYLAGPLKEGTVIDLSSDIKKEPKINVGIKSLYGFRKFGTPWIALEEEDKDVRDPKLGMTEVTAKVDAVALKLGVEDAGKLGGKTKKGEYTGANTCFIEARRNPDRFVVWSLIEGTFQSSWNELAADQALFELNIVQDQVRAEYSIERLLTILKAGIQFSEVCKVSFSTDWPIRIGFELPFEGDLHFWTTPFIKKG